MAYRSRRRISGRRLLALLVGVSLIGLLLPTSVTGWFMNLVQVLVPLQDAASRAADATGGALGGTGDIPAEEHARVRRRADALRNAVVALSARVAALEDANRQLAGIRRRGLGDRGALVPARVVGQDLLGWRDSTLINSGTLRGVRRDAAVASRSVSLNVGDADGALPGMAVLAGEWLVGWVEHAGTHTARVKLLSDRTSRRPVTIWRFEDGVASMLEAEFWLEGRGAGRMAVIDVDHRYVEQSEIRTGDLVLTLPDDPALPVPLVVGTITRIEPDPENTLLYVLTVDSEKQRALRHVYVLNLNPRPAGD